MPIPFERHAEMLRRKAAISIRYGDGSRHYYAAFDACRHFRYAMLFRYATLRC